MKVPVHKSANFTVFDLVLVHTLDTAQGVFLIFELLQCQTLRLDNVESFTMRANLSGRLVPLLPALR